nr:hypothetical protein [uncultured Gemmiger sp.]
MKRLVCLVMAVLLVSVLLCACTKEETTPTWQTTLPNTGVALTISGGEVTESTTRLFPDDGTQNYWEEPLLTVPAVTTLTLEGVQEEDVRIAFVFAWDNCYRVYDTSEPIVKVDYTQLDSPEGTLQYRFDTSYCFIVTVTTEQGTDEFILDCRRDI